MWKSICLPNFDEISHSTAEIKLLPLSENGRPSFCNSISGFDSDVCIVIGMLFYICLPNFVVIGRSAAELRRYIDFSRWPPAAILDLIWVMLDHPRSAIAGLSSILKFRFVWKLPIHAHFLGVLVAYFPQMVTHCSNPKKDQTCVEKRRLSHKAWKSVQRFDLGVGSRKKVRTGQNSQKSHKVVIFRLFGEKPPLYRLKPKFAWQVTSPT